MKSSSPDKLALIRKIVTVLAAGYFVGAIVVVTLGSPDFRETVGELFSTLLPDQSIVVQQDLRYADEKDGLRVGDFYRNSAGLEKPLPAVVIVHGGSWTKGSKQDFSEVAAARFFARNGYAAFVINYRMIDQGGFPKDIVDIKNALAYLVGNYQKLHIDPARLFLLGTSSGASSALVAAYTQHSKDFPPDGANKDTPFSVRALASISGPTDFQQLSSNPYLRQYLHSDNQKPPDAALRLASPMTYATSAEPTIFVHGKEDQNVPYDQANQLANGLAKNHTAVSFVPIEGAGHFIGSASRTQAFAHVLKFFREHDPGA